MVGRKSLNLFICLAALTLYYKPNCPYCVKVLHYLEQKSIPIDLQDVAQSSNHRALNQVPCLEIDGALLYESEDIINWLEKYDIQK